ncbi:MerR family transcriptional regulator [Ruegeria hyattellae]|uniref:MerR family transcriptional regulator n=1 Tax=Ruegeria hyattellae TaxID=3233337 RepID=UPI00355AF790
MAKSRDAFRTISEVADWLGVQAHVLRFWESKFTHVKPVKRAGGRRYYRPADMLLLGGIKHLLHDDGMTIKGVQKLLREQGVAHVQGFSQGLDEAAADDVSDGANVIRFQKPAPEEKTSTQIDMDLPPAPEMEPEAPPSESRESHPVDANPALSPRTIDRPDPPHEGALSCAPGPLSRLARVARIDPDHLPAATAIARDLRDWIDRQASR